MGGLGGDHLTRGQVSQDPRDVLERRRRVGRPGGRSTTRPMDASRSPPTESRGRPSLAGRASAASAWAGVRPRGRGPARRPRRRGGEGGAADRQQDAGSGGGQGSRTLGVELVREQGALDLLDRLGDLDAAGAGLGAVEGRAAAPHPLLVVEHLEALGPALVPAVEDEAVRVDDCRGPKYWPSFQNTGQLVVQAAQEDALRGVVEALAVLLALDALAVGSLPVVIRNGITPRGRRRRTAPCRRSGPSRRKALDRLDGDGLAGLTSLIRVLQASRFLPLMRMASLPHTPCAQERGSSASRPGPT